MFKEFKEFALKGNAVDMAIGIVVGAAFTSIVNSLVKDIITPIIGFITGGIDFTNIFTVLGAGSFETLQEAQDAGVATVNWGLFINAVFSFLIVAWVLFLIVKTMNAAKRAEEQAPPAETKAPRNEVLLEEIRDILKAK